MQKDNTSGQFPAGKHPYLKLNGKPVVFLFMEGSYTPEGDPSNFSLDGRLGRLLHSSGFAKFMDPYYDSDDASGRTTQQIWNWLTRELGLHSWKDQTTNDLEWLEQRLQSLDFLSRRVVDGLARWSYEGF